MDYTGALVLDGGTLGVGDANTLTISHGGALTAPGEMLVFDGTLQGSFLGNPLGAILASDLEAEVIHNGAATDATIVVLGEIAE